MCLPCLCPHAGTDIVVCVFLVCGLMCDIFLGIHGTFSKRALHSAAKSPTFSGKEPYISPKEVSTGYSFVCGLVCELVLAGLLSQKGPHIPRERSLYVSTRNVTWLFLVCSLICRCFGLFCQNEPCIPQERALYSHEFRSHSQKMCAVAQ